MSFTRREILAGGVAAAVASVFSFETRAANEEWFKGTRTDNGVTFKATNFDKVNAKWKRQVVKYYSTEPVGTVVVDTRNHFLYLINENKTAIRYGVGVGKEGFKWYGRSTMDRKALWPKWTPPPEMLERNPDLPASVAGGSPSNPLGARAMYLHRDGNDTGYRFHGTIQPWSIGTDASSGCIRMFNEDAMDLYQRLPVGTAVQVLQHIADQAENAEKLAEVVRGVPQ